jgi:hypothetical protein
MNLIKKMQRQTAHPISLSLVDVIPATELLDRGLTNVTLVGATQHVVQNAVAQRGVDRLHFGEIEFLEYGQHDRQAAGQYRDTISFDLKT